MSKKPQFTRFHWVKIFNPRIRLCKFFLLISCLPFVIGIILPKKRKNKLKSFILSILWSQIFNQYVQMLLMDDNERISWELFIFSEQYCDWRARASEAEGQEQLRNPNHNGAAPITVIHSPTTIIALDHSGWRENWHYLISFESKKWIYLFMWTICNVLIFDSLNERMFECIWIFE